MKNDFKHMCFLHMQRLTNFPYIEADFDALTNYELLCKIVEYLNKVIANENNQNDAINELADAFNSLKSYVDNYFNNLDVQEEINNKLDEMAESGQLTDIIAQYLGLAGMITFNTVAEMKEAQNLVNGSKCATLGYHSVNDGGNALYKIRTITNDDVIDESTIIALHDNTLIAELIIEDEINVKQLGAYGDNTHDDTNIIKKAIDLSYKSNLNTSTSWKYGRKIYFPHGYYKVTDALIDSTSNITYGSFYFVGDSQFGTSIVLDENMTELFDDNGYFGYTTFENLNFIGNNSIWINFVGGGSSVAQGLRINKCRFENFKTIIVTSGATMASEVTFFECKILNCGSPSDNCDLFIYNNQQGVNWRFIATDIESFTGSCLHYKKGTSINFYQGSIIPINGSKFIDLTDADYNTFGEGNKPNLTMYGTRFELRDSSFLLYKQDTNKSGLRAIFNECGMGGTNLPTSGFQTINLGGGNNNLTFNNCNNMLNYGIKGNIILSGYTSASDIINLNNCNVNVEDIISKSNITYTGGALGYLPQLIVDGITYQFEKAIQSLTTMSFKNQILKNIGDQSGFLIKNGGNDVTFTFPIHNFIREIHIDGIAKSIYGTTHTFTVTAYDENDNLLGSATEELYKDNTLSITVGKNIETLKLVTTSTYSSSVYKALILSVDRL